jgi:hypothetical protein
MHKSSVPVNPLWRPPAADESLEWTPREVERPQVASSQRCLELQFLGSNRNCGSEQEDEILANCSCFTRLPESTSCGNRPVHRATHFDFVFVRGPRPVLSGIASRLRLARMASSPARGANSLRSIPEAWVTDYSGDIGNNLGPKGFRSVRVGPFHRRSSPSRSA